MSSPPTVAELENARNAVFTAFNDAIAGVGSPQFCALLSAAIAVMNEQLAELIAAYNANCSTPADPNNP